MKPATAVVAFLLLAGCSGKEERVVHAVIEAKLDAGSAMVTCRESSSGTCHALFVTQVALVTAEVKQGETSGVEGIDTGTRYCVDVRAPEPAKCRLKPLADGEQIVRSATIPH